MSNAPTGKINANTFLGNSTFLTLLALKPLSHIRPYWELTWDDKNNQYITESDSFAKEINEIITELNRIKPPDNYHLYEDIILEHVAEQSDNRLFKHNGKWLKYFKDEIKDADYDFALEQAAYHDHYEFNLLKAAKGRMEAALERGQNHFDDMEDSHQVVLAAIISIILYQRVIA